MLEAPTILSLLDPSRYTDKKVDYAKRRAAEYVKALAALDAGLEAKSIYNVVLKDAKDTVQRVFDWAAEEAQTPAYYAAHRKLREETGVYLDTACVYPNVAESRLRVFEKHAADPAFDLYKAILREHAAIGAVIKALKPYVVKGRVPSENPKPVDLTNTGTCGICMRLFKMHGNNQLVHHGFQISDGAGNYFGYRAGECFGTNYQPFEISPQANIDYVKVIDREIERTQAEIAEVLGERVQKFTATERRLKADARGDWDREDVRVEVTPADGEKYVKARLNWLAEAEGNVRGLKVSRGHHQSLIDKWQPKSLPGDSK